ncbi:MAG TPA: hypothetical protein VIM73_08590, partial [Polyangiaceae bacterium]
MIDRLRSMRVYSLSWLLWIVVSIAVGACTGEVNDPGTPSLLCAQGDRVCGDRCVSTSSDVQNCGACGNACGLGLFCSGGTCSATCSFQQCSVGGSMVCADTRTNPQHCGACGRPCPDGQSCLNGVCGLACPTGRIACAGQCVDPLTDARNCGTCGTTCAAPQTCEQGSCRLPGQACPTGQTSCAGGCVDTMT